MKLYFNNCTTLEQAKNLYRTLCHKLHPDKGGKQSDFIAMYNEFKTFKPKVTSDKDKDFNFDKFTNIVLNLNHLQGVSIEFVGTWIFISDKEPNATYLQRESIKNTRLQGYNTALYSRSKKRWYFAPEGTKQFKKRGKSMEVLKQKYGVNTFETEKLKVLN